MIWNNKTIQKVVKVAAPVLIILIIFNIIFVPRPIRVETAKVAAESFQETIRADAVLRSKERYVVTAFSDGDIKRVILKVGDSIMKGDSITELFWDQHFESVRAPIGGVVSKVFRDSAGPIRRGEPILEIIDPNRLEVVAEVLTTDAVKLHPGGRVWIESWSGKKSIEAFVTRVSKAGFVKQSALGVEEERTEVTADLNESFESELENMGSTFHVEVLFQVSETPNALTVPAGALFRDGIDWAVYKAEKGRARKQKVGVFAIGAKKARIISGLSAGEEVLLYPGDLVKDGSRIRTQLVY